MATGNGLVGFTNCLLPQEDGSLVERDLWIDERRGVVVDAHHTFFTLRQRPEKMIDLKGNILSPGFLDIQINGAYGFDFSVYEGDDDAYRQGIQDIAKKIVETGVTSLLPTIITQDKPLYPKLLDLLRPFSSPTSANLLGWHAEGPFLEYSKRGAHASPFLLTAPENVKSFEEVYGSHNLADSEDWLMGNEHATGVRIITAAPEVEGVMDSINELDRRGIVVSIGHSNASTDTAVLAVKHGARLITHLFNAMPQFHHRDPSIIGLLGASPHLNPYESTKLAYVPCDPQNAFQAGAPTRNLTDEKSASSASSVEGSGSFSRKPSRKSLHLEKGEIADMDFERPFYGIIVDGIHCHPNSVRLAYSTHPGGCVLITDAVRILDPHLRDGVHEWRDGIRYFKQGDKVYLEGTDTLAGSVVTLDKCVRNLSSFTGCSLGEAIKCATFNPAKCLGIENKKGTLRPGAHADLVVLDKQGTVLSTWIRGKEVWSRS